MLATTSKESQTWEATKYMAKAIATEKLKTETQVTAGQTFLAGKDSWTDADFNAACGVGIHVSMEDIEAAVKSVLAANEAQLRKDGHGVNMSSLMKQARAVNSDMRWAEGKALKKALDDGLAGLLGPKSGLETASKKNRSKEGDNKSTETPETSSSMRTFEGDVLRFHKPGENPQPNEAVRQAHLAATGGLVVTRFPPEPNGFLHIGHAKAINFNFSYAAAHGGITYLRYDDTNPEAEEKQYFASIAESVAWLGYKPFKVTHSSDYFAQLYDFAEQLIQQGDAYVCHMSKEEIEASRGGTQFGPRSNSPYRDRPVADSLRLFREMRAGRWADGTATLRLKQDMHSANPRMWDIVAYRIISGTPHVRTGHTWCIYPSYDFAHCICDSLENITHSLCTLEFIGAREPYYWILERLGIYRPVQWEYGRLAITNTVLSKRKITQLVGLGHVSGWDDPRLYTLAAIRRRGFSAAAVNAFVEKLGITTAPTTIDVRLLEATVREDLNVVAPRRMAVLQPLLVHIDNVPADHVRMIALSDMLPGETADASKLQAVPFTSQVYIERADYSAEADVDANYFRLTPSQPVGLYKVGCVRFVREVRDADGQLQCIHVHLMEDEQSGCYKPKSFIQWVARSSLHSSPVLAEVRLYEPLFCSKDPEAVPGGFLADINPHSLSVIPDAMVDVRLRAADLAIGSCFQFQRLGYFCVDQDSTSEKLVFNKTVSLREDPLKK